MEFFDLFNVPMIFMEEIVNLFIKPDIQNVYDFSNVILTYYLFAALGTLGVYLILVVFGGIGLNKLAKKQGLKHRWMAFLPFLNTYYAGKLAGETQFFGQKMKRVGLYAMISEILYVALQLFVFAAVIISYFPEYRTLEVSDGVMTGAPNEAMPTWIEPAVTYGNLVARHRLLLRPVCRVFPQVLRARAHLARLPFGGAPVPRLHHLRGAQQRPRRL